MSKTVLTVDDSRTMRDMLLLALSGAGYRVVQAQDGMHGLEVLQQQSPDVIVTDINMLRLDGFGFIEKVRRDAKHTGVPILVLTTESDAEKKDRARGAGAHRLDRQALRSDQARRRGPPRRRLIMREVDLGFDGSHQGDLLPGMRGTTRGIGIGSSRD